MLRVLGAILTIGAAAAAIYVLSRDLLPRTQVTFAAGAEGGGYWQLAEAYAAILARDDITVDIVATEGSVDNARLLGDRAVDVALMQGGVPLGARTDALGAMFFEPIWMFSLADTALSTNPGAWQGLRIAAGREGSGTRAAFRGLIDAAGLTFGQITPVPLSGDAAVTALRGGEVDLAFFVAPITAPYLVPLLDADDVKLIAFDQLDAMVRRMPEAQIVTLPKGALRMFPSLPIQDVRLLTTVGRVDAVSNLHPTLVDRLVEAAREIHGDGNALNDVRRFPATDTGGQVMDAYAAGLIEDGSSRLNEFLPYWVVAQINRFAILLLPLVILLLPIIRAVPGLYRWRMRARVYRHYTEIREIDTAAQKSNVSDLQGYDDRLRDIDEDLADLKLPPSYRDYAYTARLHVDLIRGRIKERMRG